MKPHEVLQVMARLKPEHRLTCSELTVLRCDESTQSAVLARIAEFAAEDGWVCHQQGVRPYRQEELGRWGVVRYGEWVKQDQSLHLTESGDGGWVFTYYHEQPGQNALVEPYRHLGQQRAFCPGDVTYRRYWQLGPQGYALTAARFTGFARKEAKNEAILG